MRILRRTMPLVCATTHHLAGIKTLLQAAYYRYIDMGLEDLPNLVARGPMAVGEEQARIWGVVGAQIEERPPTLPVAAPTRAYLRAVAFQHGYSPSTELPPLLDIVRSQTSDYPDPIQYICYGSERWLAQALEVAGFQELEAVQFFQLDRLRSRLPGLPLAEATSPATLGGTLHFTGAAPDDLEALAVLDAATFAPLWHFGRRDLFELLVRGRMQIAWLDGAQVGYSAVCANTRSEGQLARLAVHPAYQGRGVGRALMLEAIRFAASEFSVLVLNTQTNNERAQRLYRSLGFRPLGGKLPVLGRQFA
jgi:ribosomal protein S18 acetylase RimI-like enzyme